MTDKEPIVKDIRDPKDVDELEDILDKGPLAVVLIYADWCGHCHRFKPMWDKLTQTVGKKANMISVNEQVLSETSLARANIDGFPSAVIVEKGSRHREFPAEDAVPNTNSFPALHDIKVMEKLVRGELPEDAPAMPSKKPTVPNAPAMPSKKPTVANAPAMPSKKPLQKQGIFDFVPNMMGGKHRMSKKRRVSRKNRQSKKCKKLKV